MNNKIFSGKNGSLEHPFRVFIKPVTRLIPCAAWYEARHRGVESCHAPNCADCQRLPAGFDGWGENGHQLGHWKSQPSDDQLKIFAASFTGPSEFIFCDSGFVYIQ